LHPILYPKCWAIPARVSNYTLVWRGGPQKRSPIMPPFAGEIGVGNPDLFSANCLSLHFLFSRLRRNKSQRKFIALDGRISLAHASEHTTDTSRISSSRAFLKVLFCSHGRNLFRERKRNELVESHAFGFGRLACFGQKGGRYAQSEIASSHRFAPSLLVTRLPLLVGGSLPRVAGPNTGNVSQQVS